MMKRIFIFAVVILFAHCNNNQPATQTDSQNSNEAIADSNAVAGNGTINDFSASYEGAIDSLLF